MAIVDSSQCLAMKCFFKLGCNSQPSLNNICWRRAHLFSWAAAHSQNKNAYCGKVTWLLAFDMAFGFKL